MKLFATLLLGMVLFVACSEQGMPDDPVPIQLSSQDLTIEEGDQQKPVFLNLQLSAAVSEPVVLTVNTEDGTAVAGDDYIAIQDKQVTIPAGLLTYALRVDILGDEVPENNESFSVVFSNVSGALLSGDRATITIENDDINTDFNIPVTGYSTPETYPGMTLVWRDEFDQAELDTDNWTFEIGNGNNGWGNQELQYYRQDNTYIKEGHLVIEARKENFGGFGYTSSRLITMNKFDFRYGRVDIRAALPEGQGIWPALWMLGANFSQVGWPACGEIDIMELIGGGPGRDDTVHGSAHWVHNGINSSHTDSITLTNGSFKDEFHVFSIRWDDDYIRWYLDDQLYNTLDINSGELSEFHGNFFFIFNVAVGGLWPGSPDASTMFPQRMIVDYIRVFQE